MKQYLIVVEKTKTGYSAHSPDILGCIATGKTEKGVEQKMKQAIEFHLEGLRKEKIHLPQAKTYSKYLEVTA